mmetsp:Transcript_34654/g.110068  ORF Transcript_34654/g.110068 Transcript_34654/m.110068 type:complete len:236 (-) Transcript_34654:1721-2428(-)
MLRLQRSARAFVPPTPKAETPEMPVDAPQSSVSLGKVAGNPSNSMCGFICLRWTFGAPHMLCSIRMHFVMPPRPAHASMCPKLDFALVRMMGPSLPFMMSRKALTSMGSPNAVPVPWHSAMVIMPGRKPASLIDALMHLCCEGPFGAVMLALRPSWFTLLPMAHASICCASSSLSSILRKEQLQPSPRTKPLAASSNVKERPPIESMEAAQYAKKVWGPSSRQTPMTSALVSRAA